MSFHLGIPVLLLAYLVVYSGSTPKEIDLTPMHTHGAYDIDPIASHTFNKVPLILDFESMIDWDALPALRPDQIDGETLWLARCIYSETKDVREMELVAWVVRNRVETKYRAKRTYRDVILDPVQFSAFNDTSRVKMFYSTLPPHAQHPNWQEALKIAHTIKNAPASLRPFSIWTRHFYSEQSMKDRRHPVWSLGSEPVQVRPQFEIDTLRFRFFEGIS